MENTQQIPSLLDGLKNQLENHASLVGSGVSNEQALRIAYGDTEAEDVLRIINEVEAKSNFIPCPLGGRCWNPLCALAGCVNSY